MVFLCRSDPAFPYMLDMVYTKNQKDQEISRKQMINSDIFNILPLDLSRLMNNPELFTTKKKDSMTTAGILKGKAFGFQQDLFIKKFAPRSPFNFFLRKLTGSRAIRIFRLSEKLLMKGLPVPAPLAYIEPTLKDQNAFYISLAVENCENLAIVLTEEKSHELQTIASLLAKMLAHWHREGAVHGDLKWPNILLQSDKQGQRFFLADLDQTKIYFKPHIAGIIKDLSRFYRSGLEVSHEHWADNFFFPFYMEALPNDIRARLDLTSIRNMALKKWRKKGQIQYCK